MVAQNPPPSPATAWSNGPYRKYVCGALTNFGGALLLLPLTTDIAAVAVVVAIVVLVGCVYVYRVCVYMRVVDCTIIQYLSIMRVSPNMMLAVHVYGVRFQP